MNAKGDTAFTNLKLLETDPSAYFEKLLQELTELERLMGDDGGSLPESSHSAGRT